MNLIALIFAALFMSGNPIYATADELVPSDEVTPIILILDGSGSMWGQVAGTTKIAIARQVIGDLMDQMDPARPVGLVAYGHREKGDCQDIEILLEPKADNGAELKSVLANINPIGMTPLANTALMVIEKLRKDESKATIILVSDGAESCGGDLCEVIRAAKEAGLDFVLHIVGFDIGESDKLALECAAREGEGVYLDATNADELSQALEQATNLTVESTSATLGVKVTRDGQPHDAMVRVFLPGEDQVIAALRTYTGPKTNPAMFHIAPGTYHLEASLLGTRTEPLWRKGVVVVEDSIQIVELDFSPGKISVLGTNNGGLWDCSVAIFKAGTTDKIAAGGRTYTSSSHNPLVQEMTPGFYDVTVTALQMSGSELTKQFHNVEIKARETIKLSHDFSTGEISVMTTNNGELWDCVVNVVPAGGGKSVTGGRTYSSGSSNPMIKTLTPGTYDVICKATKMSGAAWEHTISNVVVEPQKKTEVMHDYASGIVTLSGTRDGQLWDSMVSITQNGKNVTGGRTYTAEPKSFTLTTGVYQVSISPLKLDAPGHEFTITVTKGASIVKVADYK